MRGEVPVQAGWQPSGASALFTIGGVSQQFVLDGTGKGSANGCVIKLKGAMSNGAYTGTLVSFTINLKKLSLLPIFPNVPIPGTFVTVPVTLALNGIGHGAQSTMYTLGTPNVQQSTPTGSNITQKPRRINLRG